MSAPLPAWLRNRWLLGGLGLAAFAVFVWLVGDAFALGGWRPLELAQGRALLVALAAAAWIALELRRARRSRRENEKLLDLIAGAGGGADSAARAGREIEILRQRFEEAAAVLKTARFRGADGEQRYVHELPWYVFIGAPGSGKTTALVNSGLRFPLRGAGSDPALAGVGGTRNCDWWFTEEAVMLDTARRYTTHGSDLAADAAAWTGFLDLLKRFRPRQPLNGALVTVSISDLMLWSAEERARYAASVRERIAELYGRLGVRFPIYLLVTKADLLAGFMEFFGELDAEGRARVWGTTFDIGGGAQGPRAQFEAEFAALEQRLYAELLERLQQERDLQRRAAIYRFPQEYHGTGPRIGEFVESAFAGSPAPLLRGVYYTSGTQEGSPIDRVLGSLARSFNLERAAAPAMSGTGKSFFLMRLLREVVFPEAGLAGRDQALERRTRLLRGFAYGAIALVTVAVAALWTASYSGNAAFIASAQARTAAMQGELKGLGALRAGSEARLIQVLNGLRDLPGGYLDQASGERAAPGMGLSQSEKLGAQALRAYRGALRDLLFPYLAVSLEDALRAARGREEITAALDAYASLVESRQPAPAALAKAAARVWRLSDAGRTDLLGHLRAGLEEGAGEVRVARDEAIIKSARQRLATLKP